MARRRVDDREPVIIEDPRAIRALAHPARLAIIEALHDGQELTATDCAALTGLSASATAYHLKALEKWGIVEPGAARPDGRERPWRALGRGLEIRSSGPTAAAVETAVLDLSLDRTRDILRQFISQQKTEPAEWRDVVELDNNDLWLTIDDARELSRRYRQLIDAYRKPKGESPPPGSRRVRVTRLLVPRPM